MPKKKLSMKDIAMLFRYKTDLQVVAFLSNHLQHRPIGQLSIEQQDRIYTVMGLAKNIYKRYRSSNRYLYI